LTPTFFGFIGVNPLNPRSISYVAKTYILIPYIQVIIELERGRAPVFLAQECVLKSVQVA
jgi:hypothetical protein